MMLDPFFVEIFINKEKKKEHAWWQLLDIYGTISEKETFVILTIVGSTGQSSSGVKASDDFRWPRREFDGALANKEKWERKKQQMRKILFAIKFQM